MTYPATNSNQATELIIDVGNQLHEIINGDATTEVMTDSGPVGSVRKNLADGLLFKTQIPWEESNSETDPLQLRTFGMAIYWAPTATLTTPVAMGATPEGDSNWSLAPVRVDEYKGLWPDTGGVAGKGDLWQTQVGGTPTGEYFTALQSTTISPVNDNVNWKAQNDYGTIAEGLVVKHRRGTNAEILANTPSIGEFWVNTADSSIHTGDGTTQGGIKHVNTQNINEIPVLSTGSSAPRGIGLRFADVVNVLDFGAKGDLSFNDNTAAFEAAIQACPNGGFIFVPAGQYKFQKPASSDYHITLTKNVSFVGDGQRATRLLGYGATEAMFKVAITDNSGLLDVRNWRFSDIQVLNVEGKDCLRFGGGFSMSQSLISRCAFTPGPLGATPTQQNYCLNIISQFSHSVFELNNFTGPCYLGLFDANRFYKNTSFGSGGFAYTLECELGVYNNTFDSNTIVNRDGALHVIDASVVRFINNQCEQFQTAGENQSVPSTMLWIEGRTRPTLNVVVRDNNFGGGTNVDYLMYFQNTNKASISCNRLNPSDVADIYIASNCRYVCYEADNYQSSSISDPRDDTLFKTKFENYSMYSVGVPLDLSAYARNGWAFSGTKHAYRTKEGKLIFISPLSGGTTAVNTLILELPQALKPNVGFSSYPIYGADVFIEDNSRFRANQVGSFINITNTKALPLNSSMLLSDYQLDNTDQLPS